MRLFRFGEPGKEKPGMVLKDGTWIDTSIFGEDYGEEFFGSRGLRRLRRWAATFASSQPKVDPKAIRIGPPIVRPSKIVCIGLNYRDHAKEAKMDIPPEPVLFAKASSSIAGPFDDLTLPRGAAKVDWEIELGVVMGARVSAVPASRALDYVAGYVVVNDYSERSFQLERQGQWIKGKSADGFAPIGPFLVTPEEAGNVHDLRMFLTVNGKLMQDSSTGNMIYGVHQLISYVSQFMTLLPGDVISTGTPAGVGLGRRPPKFLKPGNVVESGIQGLGRQRQNVVAFHK
jgi:2,4-diketo-3-deoxy-L-fuconate hydrolase